MTCLNSQGREFRQVAYEDYYHCKYCDYKIKKWWSTKKGKRCNGFRYLQEHVMLEHEYEEYGGSRQIGKPLDCGSSDW